MRKPPIIVLAGLLLAAVVFIVIRHQAMSLPLAVYQGKTAQEWISWYGPLTNYAKPGDPDTPEFDAAMKALGTNALPAIVEAFAYKDSWGRKTYKNVYPKLPAFWKQNHPRPKSAEGQMEHAANVAFVSLEVFNHANLVNREELRTALPGFMKILEEKDHPGHQVLLLTIYRLFGPEDTNCVPILIQCYSETNRFVRPGAIRCLRSVGPETVTSECLKLLDGPDEALRLSAAELLGDFGKGTSTAIPALEHAIKTGNPALQEKALSSLRKIDPEAAAMYEHPQ
jgi:hypothetical protein